MRSTASIVILGLSLFVLGYRLSGNPGSAQKPQFFFEDESFQWALAQIESGHFKHPDTTQGSSGEVSRFQIMPAVWRSYSTSKSYSDPEVAWNVAQQILRERRSWFISATRRFPTPFDMYVMWNKPGLYEKLGYNRKRLPHRLRDIAERFENLVLESKTLKLSFK